MIRRVRPCAVQAFMVGLCVATGHLRCAEGWLTELMSSVAVFTADGTPLGQVWS